MPTKNAKGLLPRESCVLSRDDWNHFMSRLLHIAAKNIVYDVPRKHETSDTRWGLFDAREQNTR